MKKLPLAVDDYAVLLSVFFVLLWTVSTIVWVARYNLAANLDLTPAQHRSYAIAGYVNKLLYALGFDIAKIAIMLFYIKLTDRATQRPYWRVLVAILSFMVLDALLHFLILAVPCSPVNITWKGSSEMRAAHCWNESHSATVVNVFTFVSEALIVLAPIPMLWLAGLDVRQRVALACMFSLGGLIILASALKLSNILHSSQNLPSFGIAYIWIAVECNTALLVAGFLPLKALLEAQFRAVKRRFSATNTNDFNHEKLRQGSLVPSDPYDLDLIMPPVVFTSPRTMGPPTPCPEYLQFAHDTSAPYRSDAV